MQNFKEHSNIHQDIGKLFIERVVCSNAIRIDCQHLFIPPYKKVVEVNGIEPMTFTVQA